MVGAAPGTYFDLADVFIIVAGENITRTNHFYDVINPVSYTHLRAHETVLDLVCRLLLEKKK